MASEGIGQKELKIKTIFKGFPYQSITSELILEIYLNNLALIFNYHAFTRKISVFSQILSYSEKQSLKKLICSLFLRKFLLVQDSFFCFKDFAKRDQLKKSLFLYAKRKASISTLGFVINRKVILAFNCIKRFKASKPPILMKKRLASADLFYFLSDCVQAKKKEVIRKIKYTCKVIKLKESGNIIKRIQKIVNKANGMVSEQLKERFYIWIFNCELSVGFNNFEFPEPLLEVSSLS